MDLWHICFYCFTASSFLYFVLNKWRSRCTAKQRVEHTPSDNVYLDAIPFLFKLLSTAEAGRFNKSLHDRDSGSPTHRPQEAPSVDFSIQTSAESSRPSNSVTLYECRSCLDAFP